MVMHDHIFHGLDHRQIRLTMGNILRRLQARLAAG